MPFPRAAAAVQPVERRMAARARADCPVRLQTAGGDRHGRLWDLSETGAQVLVDDPPAENSIALLKWNDVEVFCRIVWSANDMCGVMFEKPISRQTVAETVGEPAVDQGPAATVSNIPIGQRRSRIGPGE